MLFRPNLLLICVFLTLLVHISAKNIYCDGVPTFFGEAPCQNFCETSCSSSHGSCTYEKAFDQATCVCSWMHAFKEGCKDKVNGGHVVVILIPCLMVVGGIIAVGIIFTKQKKKEENIKQDPNADQNLLFQDISGMLSQPNSATFASTLSPSV
ncbi:hypothetical protein ADUPG1_000193 [Aduncisulcus paluster]|uniref:Uncharacterized protein n=1 Tax=Aduncisulcus paluster TaxID=2918883 RepID=A0ABQ5K7E7_9EUKA|nr:hypothetical protein ADUPG1_000193 [Aduncisulcus paluster]